MKVYRIENKTNTGPFKKGLPYPHSKNWKARRPQIDGIEMTSNLYCGCKSLSDLRAWFPSNSYSALLLFGFDTYEMDVDAKHVRVCPTTRQVVFKRFKIKNKICVDLY